MEKYICLHCHFYQPPRENPWIEAIDQSQEHFSGHGSAMAQAYNHMIMPLAHRRDKYSVRR